MDSAARPVALVTGASSGIGRALARGLATEGYAVGLLARRTERLEALAAALQEAGHETAIAAADVRDREATQAAVRRLEAALGPTDLLILNAGIGRGTDPFRPSSEDLEAEFETNVFGAFSPLEVVIPGMVERGRGHVVAVSSVAGWARIPGSAGYAASKAAMTRLFESLRVDWRAKGIHTTIVHPGYVDTEILEGADHPLPFLMSAEKAEGIIRKAIRKKRKRCDFPWRMTVLVRLVGLLPDAVLRKMSEKHRKGS